MKNLLGNKKVAKTGIDMVGNVVKGVSAIGISIAMAAMSAKAGDYVKGETAGYIDKTIKEVTKTFK